MPELDNDLRALQEVRDAVRRARAVSRVCRVTLTDQEFFYRDLIIFFTFVRPAPATPGFMAKTL